jgi:hypothetical protein
LNDFDIFSLRRFDSGGFKHGQNSRRNALNSPLQLAGWGGFCVLIGVVLLPDMRRSGIVRSNFTFVPVMFAASCVLHPWCKRTAAKELSWLNMEVRAFACSLLAARGDAFSTRGTAIDA